MCGHVLPNAFIREQLDANCDVFCPSCGGQFGKDLLRKSVPSQKRKRRKYGYSQIDQVKQPSQKLVKHLPCTMCHKVFNFKSTLAIHMRSHSDAKNFECGICGKCFKHDYQLRDHSKLCV